MHVTTSISMHVTTSIFSSAQISLWLRNPGAGIFLGLAAKIIKNLVFQLKKAERDCLSIWHSTVFRTGDFHPFECRVISLNIT